MPTGTPFEVTDRYINKITDAAFTLKRQYREQEGIDLILDIQSTTGIGGGRSSGSHTGRVMFEIVAPEERDWELILPYLEENERLFAISIQKDLLTVQGKQMSPLTVYRKVRPKQTKVEQSGKSP